MEAEEVNSGSLTATAKNKNTRMIFHPGIFCF